MKTKQMTNKDQKTILLVEDEPVTSIVEKNILEKHGYNVITADTGGKAIETVEATPSIDLILMDINLGSGMDGATAAEKILKTHDLPLIFLSSHTEREVIEKIEKITSYGYIVKTSGNTVLIASIKMAFRLFEAQMKNKEQAQMLRESERNLSMTLKSIGDAVIATDTQGRIVRMNTVAEQLTGWNMGEALGRPLDEVFHIINQHTRQRVENPVAKVLQTGKTHGLANDTVLVSRQGTEYVIADSVAAIVDDKTGQTVGVVLVFRDVTEDHVVREALRESEERYRVLFEGSATGILMANVENKQFDYANPSICRMLGYTKEELTRLGIADIHPKDALEHVVAEFEAQMRGEKILASALPCLRKDGTVFYADIISAALVSSGKSWGVGFFDDITERKQAEEKLKDVRKKLVQSDKLAAVGLMAAGVAHEINNPLAVIMSSIQMLLERIKKEGAANIDSNIYTKALDMTERATNRCRKIVAGLLVFSAPARFQLDPIDIREVVEESLDVLKDQIKAHKVKVIRDFASHLPLLKADKYKLGGVFSNLITNACDAMPEGGQLKITTRLSQPRTEALREAVDEARKTVEIEFSDTGEGISEENMIRIFDPFFTTKDTNKGTGLGLSICYGIIKEHGGFIDVKSEKGKGTTFIVTLPVGTE